MRTFLTARNSSLNTPVGYSATWIGGGFHVPEPGGSIDAGVSFGQYNRITI